MKKNKSFKYKGVIEGFYGRPWTQAQRINLFTHMGKLGMNCYLYAPKNDLKHRKNWRTPYTKTELDQFKKLNLACKKNKIAFIFSISPGLNTRYHSEKDYQALLKKFLSIKKQGVQSFCLLLDDISLDLSKEDKKHFNHLAEAQASLSNRLLIDLRPTHFIIVPNKRFSF